MKRKEAGITVSIILGVIVLILLVVLFSQDTKQVFEGTFI